MIESRWGWSGLLVAACLALTGGSAARVEVLGQDEAPWVCPPCGADCHDDTYDERGNCSRCGMELVPRSQVPQVAILVIEDSDVLSFTGPAAVFAGSYRTNVFTVADTTDPIRCQGYLEVVPRYSFDDAPPPDVLIVPPGGLDVMGDEYVMGWLRKAAERSDHVLTVAGGSVIVAKTGVLDGQEVAVGGWIATRAAQYAPEVRFATDRAIREAGKFTTARDEAAAIDASLDLLAILTDDDTARATAQRLGFVWPRERD